MLSDSLVDGLRHYRIGSKIRVLRLQKRLALAQLGAHAGLSAGMLSKIERGLIFPTLPTLLRIALVFGVSLDHFFAERGRSIALVRREDRLPLPDQIGQEPVAYFFESLDFPVTDRTIEAYYAEFPSSGKRSAPHKHDGKEFIYVIQGRLTVSFEGESFALEKGDAMTFDSMHPHTYCRDSNAPCRVIVVTTARSAPP